jgi:hypothetical protein
VNVKTFRIIMASACTLALGACTSHRVQVEPIEVKPIHLTMDINLRVQRELDRFFDFEEEPATGEPKEADKVKEEDQK